MRLGQARVRGVGGKGSRASQSAAASPDATAPKGIPICKAESEERRGGASNLPREVPTRHWYSALGRTRDEAGVGMVARDEQESAAEQATAESPESPEPSESANESGAWTMVCFWRCPSRTCQNFERSRVVEP